LCCQRINFWDVFWDAVQYNGLCTDYCYFIDVPFCLNIIISPRTTPWIEHIFMPSGLLMWPTVCMLNKLISELVMWECSTKHQHYDSGQADKTIVIVFTHIVHCTGTKVLWKWQSSYKVFSEISDCCEHEQSITAIALTWKCYVIQSWRYYTMIIPGHLQADSSRLRKIPTALENCYDCAERTRSDLRGQLTSTLNTYNLISRLLLDKPVPSLSW